MALWFVARGASALGGLALFWRVVCGCGWCGGELGLEDVVFGLG